MIFFCHGYLNKCLVTLTIQRCQGNDSESLRTPKIKNLLEAAKLDFEIQALFEVQVVNDTLSILDSTVLDMSAHPQPAYKFGIEGYDLYTNGQLVDKIAPC